MVKVTDTELLAHASRIKGKVSLITGGASGIGKAIALLYAQHGAKLVIGDIDATAAEDVVSEIKKAGGEAVSQRCDVTIWEDQVALFELARTAYGFVDVVIANAGIFESQFFPLQVVDGKLAPPNLKTTQVNLVGVLYTSSLALHYLVPEGETPPADSVKALVLMGSGAAFQAIYGSPLYSSAKAGVLAVQRSLSPLCTVKGIRSGSVHPFFVDTPLLSGVNELIDGFSMVPIQRVAATCLAVATNPDPDTSERPWWLPDSGEVERLHDFQLNEASYRTMNDRLRAALGAA